MSKIENLKRIEESGIVAVVRAESSEQAIKIAEAVKAGGIQAIETIKLCNRYQKIVIPAL